MNREFSYGHGLYFASAKEIAEWYRKQLSEPHWKYKNIRINDLHGLNDVYSGYDGYPDERKVAGYVISYAKSKVTATTISLALKNIDKAIDQVSSKKYNAPQSLADRFKKDDQELITKYQMVADMIKKMEGYANKVDSPEKTTRETVSNALSTYFVCDLQNYSFKDDIASMEAPIFSLSTQEDKQIWVWTSDDGKKTVEVAPSVYGRATVFDKDVLIFAASQLMAGINKGEIPSKTIRFKARD